MNENYKELQKKLKKEYVEKKYMDEVVLYVEKLEQSLIDNRKENEKILKEKEKLNTFINEQKQKELQEEEDLKKLIEESEKKKLLQQLKEKREQEQKELEMKERTCSFDRFKPEVLSLYEDWVNQDERIADFKEQFMKCRNIVEAQHLRLRLKKHLSENFDYETIELDKGKYNHLNTNEIQALDEELNTPSNINKIFTIPENWD